ncbi:1,4-alpha-glucan branching protein GlgB [Tepidibacter formicigenes]|jgi:1,4-alpha-glucan branching enzyme|uniref:1,4-alpha-glucan branching enzyme GlgB n=1 Tax=Tepidibacter formicigenes DSM 15518 TaxID=1123349 RepID=A0A1M6SJM2_9FIRM|nr:1,4-alpha-glucan branching protein GlgB [Tepidibacter formicigenes]SHK44942.1 1,4-alpha-glucan branching enzyme [Tepidibacter formicigenes DSM 15518]
MDENLIDYLPESFFNPYYFCQGRCFKSYKFLGAHLLEYNGLKGVSFTVFAPNAKKINVVGNFNSWDGSNYSMKKIEKLGIWNIFISNLGEGDIYKYEIYTQNGNKVLKADPYGFHSEIRPNTASIIASLDKYIWNDEDWMKKRKKEPKHEKPINIYELHLGSWKRNKNNKFLNYREIANEIIDYIRSMGYTHIELLPVAEHPFDGSWGYQITGYYSITSRYGKPEDFMYFIDKCHQKGIGVILDWVPGHFCKDEHGLYKFDGTTLYEYDDELMSENIEWGTSIFDHGKNEVVNFLISNAMFWFDKYHIDGLRVDAVSYMLYLDAGKKEGQWRSNTYGGRENISAIEFLRKLNKTISTYYPGTLMIAEESTSWPHVTGATEIGGLGFDYKWNMGWMNDMLKYMEMDPIYRKWHHNLITFSFMYAFSENFILPLSHDEVVHGKKSLIEKMPGDYWQKFANLRVFFSYMIAHPGKKLLFMGNEFAQFREWNYSKDLDWLLLGYEKHQKMKFFVKELNNIYLNEKALHELESDCRSFSWIDHQNYEQSVIIFMRKGKKEDDFIIIVCNFTPEPRYNYKIGVPKLEEYIEVFNSDLEKFGGSGVKNDKIINSCNLKWHNQPYSIDITIPPLGSLYIKLNKKR